jgi:hypothetical protein
MGPSRQRQVVASQCANRIYLGVGKVHSDPVFCADGSSGRSVGKVHSDPCFWQLTSQKKTPGIAGGQEEQDAVSC